jgi:DNA-binding CsgD family transcriptional regulator
VRAEYELYGRRSERAALDSLFETVRAGSSGVVVLRGEAGIGKTALLEHALADADGYRVARAAGVESEMELAFGALHQLCAPFLSALDRLPPPQRNALRTAFGLSTGRPPDRFLVGLAVLSLLAVVAEDRPLLCVVDDAQWLDRVTAQTLVFVARRLLAEPIGLVFAAREPAAADELSGLRELRLSGLDDLDAHALLEAATPGRIDKRVRDRIVAETRGNPLAILELPRGLSTTEIAGGFGNPDARPLATKLEQRFLHRFEELPPETRLLLVTAAAEPLGDVVLLWRAAERLGIGPEAAAPAEVAGLVTIGARVRFRHPLVRSAVYYGAAARDRREAHQALAGATDAVVDPDRLAWHLARAAERPDEAVAAELERSADRARARGGLAAAAAFLERAVELTPEPDRRGGRALAAAHAKYQAGAYDAALQLLDAAELGRLDDLVRARAELLRGRIAFVSKGPSRSLPLLVDAARRLEALDAKAARDTYREAIYAALTAGQVPSGGVQEIAEDVLRSAPPIRPDRFDLLLRGVATIVARGYEVGVPLLHRALKGFRDEPLSVEEGMGWLPLACRMAHDAWAFETWTDLSADLVDLARREGALAVLPSALLLRLSNRAFAGDFAGARMLAAEASAIGEATGSRFLAQYGALVIEPWRGDEDATLRAVEAITGARSLRGEGKVLTATQWAAAVLFNGQERFEEAFAAAEKGFAHPQEFGLSTWSLFESIEAAAQTGRRVSARQAVQVLARRAEPSGSPWALGTLAVARALVSDDTGAEALFAEAIECLDQTDVRVMRARARLLYGEWLLRQRRPADAEAPLRAACAMFEQMGASAFAARARRRLDASGVRVPPAQGRGPALTPQEAQIAHLAAAGLTNQDIGAELFLSAHTIDWHLRKVFLKLGIRSRRQLRTAMSAAGESIPG